jgi:hypothetical protein
MLKVVNTVMAQIFDFILEKIFKIIICIKVNYAQKLIIKKPNYLWIRYQ